MDTTTHYFDIKIGLASILLVGQSAQAASILDVIPGTNNIPITEVTYDISGSIVTQSSEATSVETNTNSPVFLNTVTIDSGSGPIVLNSFNTEGATVANVNFDGGESGVGVFNGGVSTPSTDPSFEAAIAGTTQDSNLLNYFFYDGTSGLPSAGTSDYDLLFDRGLLTDDYILVSERDGNTFFSIVPLDANGEVIDGANTLRFGGPTTSGSHLDYDWRSGYASSTYQTSQDFGFSVASVDLFFQDTMIVPETVFGFRIDNDGDADVKFLGLSDNPFTDNPEIPEISNVVPMMGLLGFSIFFHRRRTRRS